MYGLDADLIMTTITNVITVSCLYSSLGREDTEEDWKGRNTKKALRLSNTCYRSMPLTLKIELGFGSWRDFVVVMWHISNSQS